MLERLMKEIPNMTLRLMGLRVTHIVSTKKPGIDFFGRHRTSTSTKPKLVTNDSTEWEVWPEAEFEEAARQERDNDMNELEKLSQEQVAQPEASADGPEEEQEHQWICPICTNPQAPDDSSFNAHIDFCLSRQTIKEVVKATSTPERLPTSSKLQKPTLTKGKGKRGRPKNEVPSTDHAREKRRAFFANGT
jgi:DNA polymerase kappa